jgi:hypothetical protein
MEFINIPTDNIQQVTAEDIIASAQELITKGIKNDEIFLLMCSQIAGAHLNKVKKLDTIKELSRITKIPKKLWDDQIKEIKKEKKDVAKAVNTPSVTVINEESQKTKNYNFWRENGFYQEGGKYWNLDNSKKQTIEVLLSNFTLTILYHLDDGTNNTGRLVKLNRSTSEESLVEILSSEFSMDKFETILKSNRCSFFGSMYDLKRIITYYMDNEIPCIKINTLGYNPEYDFYVFADGIIVPRENEQNEFLKVNDLGIVDYAGSNYYLPAYSATNLENDEYQAMREYNYKEGNIDFKEFADLLFKAYGVNAAIGICHVINSLFWDIVFKECEFFPFLFLFGQAGGGKTSFIELLLRMFGGGKIKGTTIKGTTDKGLSRTVSQRRNSLFYLKEYTNDIEGKVVNFFKNAYDGDLYTMAQKSNDNRTNTLNIKTACMVDGNQLPTAEAAMFSRMIIITFKSNVFTPEMAEAYNKLGILQNDGFCGVTREILKFRVYFKKNFQKVFKENLEIVKNGTYLNIKDLPERTKKHIAFLITPFIILKDKLKFPFSEAEITEAIIEYSISQNDMFNEVKDTSLFWEAASYNLSEDEHKPYGLRCNRDYTIDTSANVVSIKYKQFYASYITYCKLKTISGIDSSSMKSMLTEGYPAFIHGQQKSLGGKKVYVDDVIGSCYKFKVTSNDNPMNRLFYIENIELKFKINTVF